MPSSHTALPAVFPSLPASEDYLKSPPLTTCSQANLKGTNQLESTFHLLSNVLYLQQITYEKKEENLLLEFHPHSSHRQMLMPTNQNSRLTSPKADFL